MDFIELYGLAAPQPVGCSPGKDTSYPAPFLLRTQSLHCSQFPRLFTKYDWQEFLFLSAGFPFPSPLQIMFCVKNHSHDFSVCPCPLNYLSDQSKVIYHLTCFAHPTPTNCPWHPLTMGESLKTLFTKTHPDSQGIYFPEKQVNKTLTEPF